MSQKRANEILGRLLDMFNSGDLPAAVAMTTINTVPGAERPCDKWSMGNRIMMFLSDTKDARGYRQWEQVGRHVKKGAKAFFILAPNTRKISKKIFDPISGEEKDEKETIITGFRFVPVFRLEDTEGDPLLEYKPLEPPPLFDIAWRFVKDIRYEPFIGKYYGYFDSRNKEIVLNTYDAHIFFHELAHAVHHQVKPGGLKGGQQAEQEIVAETVAAALCELYGFKGHIRDGWEYIKSYADKDSQKALKEIMGVLSDVEKVLEILLSAEEGRQVA